MKEETSDFDKRLKELRRKVRHFNPQDARAIRDDMKKLYVDIAYALKSLTEAQRDLRIIAQEYKRGRSSQTEVSKFYSFVKSQTSAESDIATLIDRAWNLIVMEDYDEATQILKRALDIDPENIKVLGLMGLALMHQELYDEAMLYLQQVLIIESYNLFALNNLGYIYYKKAMWGEAIEHFIKAVKQTKDRKSTLYANYYLGLVYYERSMFSDAVKFFKQALKAGLNLQDAYYFLGLAETKRYEFKEAVDCFDKCIRIDKGSKYGMMCATELSKIKPLIGAGEDREE